METFDRDGSIPDAYWEGVDAALHKARQPDGSWCRQNTDPPAARVALTGHAAATLLFIRNRRYDAHRAGCDGAAPDPAVDAAMAWLDAHAAEGLRDPSALFAVQRLASASGRRSFGGADWYNAGAAGLLARQNADGSWPAAPGLTGADPAARRIPETADAVLFLVEGRVPLLMGKLIYDAPAGASPPATRPTTGPGSMPLRGPGDRRPADVPNFVEWSAEQLEMNLSWRQVRLADGSSELPDFNAPLLYVSGGGPLAFTPDEEEQLRSYVRRGGLIMGNADCGSKAFADAFVAPRYEALPRVHLPGNPADPLHLHR